MVSVTPGRTGWDAWSSSAAGAARERFRLRNERLIREKVENDARLAAKAAAKLRDVENESAQNPEALAEKERKRAIIQAALDRARQQVDASSGKKS
jgi:electron transport complex protein RnfB